MDIAPTYPIYNQGCNPLNLSVGWATKYSSHVQCFYSHSRLRMSSFSPWFLFRGFHTVLAPLRGACFHLGSRIIAAIAPGTGLPRGGCHQVGYHGNTTELSLGGFPLSWWLMMINAGWWLIYGWYMLQYMVNNGLWFSANGGTCKWMVCEGQSH